MFTKLINLLQECETIFSHPSFTDRHGMADRIKEALAEHEKQTPRLVFSFDMDCEALKPMDVTAQRFIVRGLRVWAELINCDAGYKRPLADRVPGIIYDNAGNVIGQVKFTRE